MAPMSAMVVLLMVAVTLFYHSPAFGLSINGHPIVVDEAESNEAAQKSGEVKYDCSSLSSHVEDNDNDMSNRPYIETTHAPDGTLITEGSNEETRFGTDSESNKRENAVPQNMQQRPTEELPRVSEEDSVNGIFSEHPALTFKLDGCPRDELPLASPVREIHRAICREFRFEECHLLDAISFESRGESRYDRRRVNVTLSGGRLYGLRVISAKYTLKESSLVLVLKWRTLRMFYELTTDERGLENVMDVEVRLPLIRVFVHKSGSKPASVEIELVEDVVFHLVKDPSYPYDLAETAWSDVQSRLRGFIHEKLWYFLQSRVERVLDGGIYEHLPPFCT